MPLRMIDTAWDSLSPLARMRRQWEEESPQAQFQERFAELSPFARLGRRGGGQQQLRLEDLYEPSQDEVQAKVKELGTSSGMNALRMLGKTLDTFGGAVRNQLTSGWQGAENPSGRDMLESWGWLDKNTPGIDWGDVAGFAAEVVTDPLTYLGFGLGGALKHGGKALARAGLLEKLPAAAAYKMQRLQRHLARAGQVPTTGQMGTVAIKEGGKVVGSRAARTLTNVWDVLRHETPELQKYVLDDLMSKGLTLQQARRAPIAGALGIGIPFTRFQKGFGGFGLSRLLGGNQLDRLGNVIRWSPLGRGAAQLFSPAAGNMWSKEAQIAARDAYHGITLAEQTGRGMGVRHMLDLEPLVKKYGDDPLIEAIRVRGEKIAPSTQIGQRVEQFLNTMHPADRAIFDKAIGTQRQQLADFLGRYRQSGASLNPLDPDFAAHYPRYLDHMGSGIDPASKLFQTYFPSQRARADLFRQIPEGTAALDEMVRLPELVGPQRTIQDLGQATDFILQRYGYNVMPRPQAKQLAKWLSEIPEPMTRRYGSPLWNFTEYMTKGNASLAAAKAAVNFVGTHAKPMGQGMVPLSKVFEGMGGFADKAGAFTPELLQRVTERMHLPQGTFNDLTQIGLPEGLVQDAVRFLPKPKAFEGLNPVLSGFDKTSNMYRTNFTIPFPAFHVRNRNSGMVANILDGIASLNPFTWNRAGRMLQGKTLSGFEKAPWVASELAARGLPPTAENAMKLLQEGVAATNLIGAQHALRDVTAAGLGKEFDHLIPGLNPAMGSYAHAIASGLEKAPGSNWFQRWLDLRKTRGAFTPGESIFAPARVGENLSWSVEARNRLKPWLDLIEKGYTPSAATKLVQRTHINYGKRAFTNFENTIMSRLFPFYRFHSRMLANTAKKLASRPGGPYGQMLRLTNDLQNDTDVLPDYLRQGMAIPLGTNAEGGPRVLGGFSLMHEPAMQHIANIVGMNSVDDLGKLTRQEAGEILSQSHPLSKAVAEWAFGRSLFQRGPEGGRNLADQDPVVGRTISNVQKWLGYRDMKDNEVKPFLYPVVEHALANSPISRLLSSARQLSDYRKYDAYGLPLLASLGGGFRVTDVDPRAQESILRELVMAEMKNTGEGQTWEDAYIPLEAIQKMDPAAQYDAIMLSRLRQILKARSRARGEGRDVAPLGMGLIPPAKLR